MRAWVAGPLVHEGLLRYPLPAHMPVSWLSHTDLATATVAALALSPTGAVDLGGADVVKGTELAAAFSAVLGRPVRYVAQDLDEFEAGLTHALGATTAAGVVSTYRWVASYGHDLYDLDPAALQKTLAISLTPLSTWIATQPWTELAS